MTDGYEDHLTDKRNTNPSAFLPFRATGLETIECQFFFLYYFHWGPSRRFETSTPAQLEVTNTVKPKFAMRERERQSSVSARRFYYHLAVGVNAYNLHMI